MIRSFYVDCKKIIDTFDQYRAQAPQSGYSFLEQAVIVLEDRRFFYHTGFDLISIGRAAIRHTQRALRPGGASTIEQQLVRTITNRRKITLKRKIREIVYAFLVFCRYSKRDILFVYIQIAFFGTNLIGAEKATKKLYSKSYTDLTVEEASLIASLLKYPAPLKISRKWESSISKRTAYAKILLKKKGIKFNPSH